jgi:hypothetical protein
MFLERVEFCSEFVGGALVVHSAFECTTQISAPLHGNVSRPLQPLRFEIGEVGMNLYSLFRQTSG